MRFITFTLLFLCFNNCKALQQQLAIHDTTFVKSLTYKKLDGFVSYHILKDGKPSNDKSLVYILKPIAVYYYFDHSYISSKSSKEDIGTPGDLAELIQSNKFSGRVGFHGIFKVNSKIAFKIKPDILRKMSVYPKEPDIKHARLLMDKLKREAFVGSLTLDSMRPFTLGKPRGKTKKIIYIRVRLKAQYCNLSSLDHISNDLKKWAEVDDAIYTQLFSGKYEANTFYDVTSEKGMPANKNMAKQDTSSWNSFLKKLKH